MERAALPEHRVQGALRFQQAKDTELGAASLLFASHQTRSSLPEGKSRGSVGSGVVAHGTGKLAWLATPHWLSAPFSRRM